MAKSTERIAARKLRRSGESIKKIAHQLRVSPSSVSIWCRDIELTKDQINILERNSRDPFYGKRLLNIQKQRKARLDRINQLRIEGISNIGILSKRELFLFGIALYWAEGFKKDSQVGFANSNPEMIRVFIKWLHECCDIKPEELSLRVTINSSHRHRIQQIEEFWATVCKVPVSQFQKPFFQDVIWKKQYENPNEYFGVLRVRVRKSTNLLRRIHGWIEGSKLIIDQPEFK